MPAEQKLPKSWGNGYFRFTIMDVIKLVTFLFSAFALYNQMDKAITVGTEQRAALEKRLDRIERQQDYWDRDRNGRSDR